MSQKSKKNPNKDDMNNSEELLVVKSESEDDPENEPEHEEEEKESIGSSFFPASGQTEISGSLKNFRHHPDMENFYRFIYENDLRHEALHIIETLLKDKRKKMKA